MSRTNPPGPARQTQGTDSRPNSLGLDGKRLDALLARVDGAGGGKPNRRRKYVRWAFRKATLELQINHPGGSAITCRVACRNLSCGGMSVMHSAFIYPGSACVVSLPHPGGGTTTVTGAIVRCSHVQGMVHEIGIEFDTLISAGEFMNHGPLDGQFSLEAIDPAALMGIVLHIEHCPLEQKLIQHYVRGTKLRLRPAKGAEQAAVIARDGCDIVLCNFQLAGPGAGEALAAVRGILPDVPVVMVTTESSPAILDGIRRLKVSAFLPKPFSAPTFHRAIGEFLLIRAKKPKEVGSSAEPLGDLAAEVESYPGKLEAAVKSNDPANCYVVCEQIAATARAMRLPALERVAQKASASLAATMSVAESDRPVRELIAACARRTAA